MGLLERFKERLGRTRETLGDGITGVFRGGRAMDAQALLELEELLYTADLGAVAGEVSEELARLHRRGDVRTEDDVRAALRDLLLERLPEDCGGVDPMPAEGAPPLVVLVVGVNGSGKTTTIAKLADRWAGQGLRVLVGACDTYRAAAADQLEVWAGRAEVEIVRKAEGADPASVAFESIETAIVLGYDVVVLDTAGRLHTQKNLMAELEKIRRACDKRLPGAPHETWIVLDATIGQNAIQQARLFQEHVPLTGIVVAKLDGTARGGAVFGIAKEVELPVRFVGTGERKELIEPFEPEAFVEAIVGAG